MDYLSTKYLRSRKIPSTACSGCGLGQCHKALVKAIDEVGFGINDIIWGTSIGCAGRQTYATWKGDSFAGTHGRVYAIARGLRLALPPEKKLVLSVGDGDAFGIGFNHLLHAVRTNTQMTVMVCDNLGYQSTGGQYGWTTPEGVVTDSSPYGMFEPNWVQSGRDVLAILREAGATFLARHVSMDGAVLVGTLKKALQNNGFSLVHVVYPCTTNFANTALGTRKPVTIFKWIKDRSAPLGKEKEDTLWRTGVYHDASNSRPEFSQLMREKVAEIHGRHEREGTD
ncbi:MAG: 2-oxoglutarate ferredoxin oxidoreductase subunit beta [Candidatus Abyssobacteria bacterium SURF_17]|uniref:2-oxoglutarate ferredoxin oxidoreductase subunit beta n=1 Tax=Candidatus Abyssobacteria bacterium SURF_17 TaxID=2093361 RepID=A0A419EXW4_9BACT|nr:MAG: 2-oxoglutarate ferredoxin oxidoreductase subunit beta [Candidatus Abyssubacteria bacterium SURF_17]